MKSAVIVFPASNRDRDTAEVLEKVIGKKPHMVWHADSEMPNVDLIVIPGGFSYGDYLRCGAMAAQSHIMRDVKKKADAGVAVLGICNGFQVLTEAGLLPGALQKNRGLTFLCQPTTLVVASTKSVLTRAAEIGQELDVPINHFSGAYTCDDATYDSLVMHDQIVLRYRDNPNGSRDDIAGVCNQAGNVVGLMPHPERAMSTLLGSADGRVLLEGIVGAKLAAR